MAVLFPGSELLLVAAAVIYFLYRYTTRNYGFWAERGVPFAKPTPFFGNTLQRMLVKESPAESQRKRYRFFGDRKFGGEYTFMRPTVFLKDPALVEQILIKDFSTFYNRSLNRDPNLKPLDKNLLTLQNSEWKSLRSKLTPTFTSGKMKILHQELLSCCDYLVQHLSKFADSGEPLEMKKTTARFVVYSIGCVAFGLKLDSLEDPNCKFAKMGEDLFRPSFDGLLVAILGLQFPAFAGYLKRAIGKVKSWISESEQDRSVFFMNVVKDTVDYREKNNIRRNDFLQILMEQKKQDEEKQTADNKDELKFDLEMMSSSAFVFLLAGYETNASTLSFMMYELAANQDIQERLLREIVESLETTDGVPTYEAVKEMKYLDQVLSETLRLYPPIPSTFRVSRSAYKIPDSSVVLPEGTSVMVPIYSLQRDPKYFPDPDKFDPERFAEGAKIVKGSYLPFGDGPRICIGQRLAILEIKLTLIKVLLSYKLTVNEKTQTPITFSKAFFLNPVGGIWLNLSRRNTD